MLSPTSNLMKVIVLVQFEFAGEETKAQRD